MQTRMMIVGLAAAIALGTGCGGDPEKKIGGSIDEMATIMEDNMESPKDGVVKLREYARDNLPGIVEAYAKAIVELDKIEDPAARAERAKEMVSSLEEPMKKIKEVGQKFAMKAMTDEDTQKYIGEIGESWGKTLEQLESVMKTLGGGIASASPEAGARYNAAM